jgi:hypothetical protein
MELLYHSWRAIKPWLHLLQKFDSSNPLQRRLQAALNEGHTHLEAATAVLQQLQDAGRVDRGCAIISLALNTGLGVDVLGGLASKPRATQLQVHITMVQCGMQQYLRPVLSSCTTSKQQ